MAVYPESIQIFAKITAGWTDITGDVMEKITGFWGIRSNREVDRVADTGVMYLTMNNATGLYAPALGTAYAGWGKGTQIKMVVTYKNRAHIRFFGTIDSLKITGGALGERRVYATVKTWMNYATKYPLITTGIETNKRADEAMRTIVNAMPLQPQSLSLETGAETLATVFDATTSQTTAAVEFNKLALSEMGYIYERMEYSAGTQLTFQARTTRKGTDTPTSYSVPADDNGYLLKTDGSYLLKTDGSKIILNQSETISFSADNNMQDIEVEYGANVINRMTVIAYPRKVDTSLQVLASLGYPQQIGAGETITIRVLYYDPNGGAKVNAQDGTMVTPVSGTDYEMNDQQDGLGTDITSDLDITATYGSEGVTWELTNNNAATGYIVLLQARGYGIYTYTSTESTVENAASYNAYGFQAETIHQYYQQNTSLGKNTSAQIIEKEREPRTILNKVFFNANKTNELMWGFLVYDVGDLVPVVEDISGIDSQYYIHAVHFEAIPGPSGSAIIDYAWTLKENQSLTSNGSGSGDNGFSLISLEFGYNHSTPSQSNEVEFGNITSLNNVDSKTISLWVKLNSGAAVGWSIWHGVQAASRYWGIKIQPTDVYFYQYNGIFTAAGLSLGTTWHHILATKTRSHTVSPIAPTIYIDGVSKTVSTTVSQSITDDETSYLLHFGAFLNQGLDGQMKDVRIYDTILTASDALGIYNAGAGGSGYTDNLVFQAPVVRTKELTYFTDRTLTETDRVLENVYGYVGKPRWDTSWTAPITRLP